MRVIGISPLDKDSTVSFMEDGRVLFACGEERLSRVKLQSGFPHQALALGFARTGWTVDSIDTIAYAFLDWPEEAALMAESMAHDATHNAADAYRPIHTAWTNLQARPYSLDRREAIPGLATVAEEFVSKKPWAKRTAYHLVAGRARLDQWYHRRAARQWLTHAIADHRHWAEALAAGLEQSGLAAKPLVRFRHHLTHAANAFYSSGFDDALILTLDGYGSGMCGGIYRPTDTGLSVLHEFRFPNSLGTFYEHVTSGLGFKPNRHEGKIVGLAAYGEPKVLRDYLLSRFQLHDGDYRIVGSLNPLITRALATRYSKRDIASAYQSVLEKVVAEVVGFWITKTGCRRVVASGGVHANVKLNQRIAEVPGVEQIFVYPNMGDGGCGTGAAMLVFGHEIMHRQPRYADVYLGPDYSDEQIETALKSHNLPYDVPADLELTCAELLAADSILGRFDGRMEYGPRALGNRSVLYPARQPAVNQWLNQQLGRTEFMPFAPVCLAEKAHELFENLTVGEQAAEFMTVTFNCTAAMKAHSPAAVHVDGTARPQIVSATINPRYHRLLWNYYTLTGIPVLINTSFNMHEEPIVASPDDAIRAFLAGKLDYLAIGKFLVRHPNYNQIAATRQRAQAAHPVHPE